MARTVEWQTRAASPSIPEGCKSHPSNEQYAELMAKYSMLLLNYDAAMEQRNDALKELRNIKHGPKQTSESILDMARFLRENTDDDVLLSWPYNKFMEAANSIAAAPQPPQSQEGEK